MTRNYGDMRVDVIGPVVSRVFNPNNAIADRMKHVIEPSFSVQRRTEIANQDRIPDRDRLRHHRRRRHANELRPDQPRDGAQGQGRRAAGRARRAKCSTSRCARVITPTRTPASSTTSYSYGYNMPRRERVLADLADGARHADHAAGDRLPARIRPERARRQPEAARHEPQRHAAARLRQRHGGLDAARRSSRPRRPAPSSTPTTYIQTSADFRLKQGQFGGSVAFNYDIARSTLINQRYVGFYNAQCCGVQFEYQSLQLSEHEPVPAAEGPPLQHVVHAGGSRVVFELLRSVRRFHVLRFKAA